MNIYALPTEAQELGTEMEMLEEKVKQNLLMEAA